MRFPSNPTFKGGLESRSAELMGLECAGRAGTEAAAFDQLAVRAGRVILTVLLPLQVPR